MGTAGLDVERLVGLLEQRRVDGILADDDRAVDHCVLRLSTVRRPGEVAFLEYENQGVEPRLVGLSVVSADDGLPDALSSQWQHTLTLVGLRAEDPDKIAQWIESTFVAERNF